MNKDKLDQIVDEIRNEPVETAALEGATARVRERIFPAARADREGLDLLRECADFQALIPASIDGSLPPARALLLQDHVNHCVGCRHSLEAARSGKVRVMARPRTVSNQIPAYAKWAMAAAAAVVLGFGTWGALRMLPSAGTRAVVESVNGTLYQVSDHGSLPVFSGRELSERDEVRTSKGSTAILRLVDGSRVELNERTEVYVTKGLRGATIHLDRGNVIVQAAKQRNGTLDVATADCLVSVKGTIFSVTRGTKGSRVSVVEGAVKVDHGRQSEMLHKGDQTATDASLSKIPVTEDIAWSANSAQYLAVLGELSTLQKQIEAIPTPGLRYASKLTDLVPADTAVYASIPNVGPTLSEAYRLFQDRVQQSDVLRQWWSQHQPGPGEPTLDEIVQKVRTFSDYLGNEIVLAIPAGGKAEPVILAEVVRPGLREYLQAEMTTWNARAGHSVARMVEEAPLASETAGGNHQMNIFMTGNVIAVSPASSPLRQVAAVTADTANDRFSNTRLFGRVQQAYESGAGWVFAVDMEQMLSSSVNREERRHQRLAAMDTGMGNLSTLLLERKEIGGKTENSATVSFSGNRTGIASWLAAPGPMGTLDFISPDATMAAAFVVKNPWELVNDLFRTMDSKTAETDVQVDRHRVITELAQALGGEFAFALDGPLLPTPSWKFAIEVYNPDRLQAGIVDAINQINQQSTGPKLQLTKADAGGRTFYTVTADGAAKLPVEIDYTYVDSYLLAASSRTLLTQSIQNRQTGYGLAHSDRFRAQLPRDGQVNFSAILYHNIGTALAPIADQLKNTNALSPAQRNAIDTLAANSTPGLIYAYGRPDRIVVATNSGFFGLNVNSLALPAILQNITRPQSATIRQ
ncbi:MAG: FecR domain-containing protein [Acidobacteriota bacterium]|nr:FecR domain-containing protein [Acidobacteriota bacterium]